MTTTAPGGKWLPDEIWNMVAPLIPPPKKRRFDGRGRPRLDDRKVLTGIIFVLRTGIPWRHMPPELGCGPEMTCLRRLREWHREGVFQKLYEVLLGKLKSADKIDWSRAVHCVPQSAALDQTPQILQCRNNRDAVIRVCIG
jgi:transposase